MDADDHRIALHQLPVDPPIRWQILIGFLDAAPRQFRRFFPDNVAVALIPVVRRQVGVQALRIGLHPVPFQRHRRARHRAPCASQRVRRIPQRIVTPPWIRLPEPVHCKCHATHEIYPATEAITRRAVKSQTSPAQRISPTRRIPTAPQTARCFRLIGIWLPSRAVVGFGITGVSSIFLNLVATSMHQGRNHQKNRPLLLKPRLCPASCG